MKDVRVNGDGLSSGGRQDALVTLTWAHKTATAINAIPLLAETLTTSRYARLDLATTVVADPSPYVPPALSNLTARERDVLAALADGRSNREIAERLYISPRTVAIHVSNILHKLGVADRIQAAHAFRRLH